MLLTVGVELFWETSVMISRRAIVTTGLAGLGGYWWKVVPDQAGPVDPVDFGARANGTGDDAEALDRALASGATAVDGRGRVYRIGSPIRVPAGVVFSNFHIVVGRPGIDAILVDSGATLKGEIVGTGRRGIVERGVYPVRDGVSDVVVDLILRDITYGLHAQPVASTSPESVPRRWKGQVRLENIIGLAGRSEAYGVLLSPAHDCDLTVIARNVERHAVYLSAGATGNRIDLDVEECRNYAAQIFSRGGQARSSDNHLSIKARNLSESVRGQGGALAIVGGADRNVISVEYLQGGVSQCILVEGSSDGPYPVGNIIEDSIIEGAYTGLDVIRLINADGTVVRNNVMRASATVAVVSLRRAGRNGALHGGTVTGNLIEARGATEAAIYDELINQPSEIGPNTTSVAAGRTIDDRSEGRARIRR